MKFIDIIIENSTEKIAKLYNPAYKASLNPENGITIQNKSAYHVIKDCATIAHGYLPIYVFEKYKNPFTDLKGKFKKEDISDFITSSEKTIAYKHLLCIILDLYHKTSKNEKSLPEIVKSVDSDINDPYGDYGSDLTENFNKNNSLSDPYNILCQAFGINS